MFYSLISLPYEKLKNLKWGLLIDFPYLLFSNLELIYGFETCIWCTENLVKILISIFIPLEVIVYL